METSFKIKFVPMKLNEREKELFGGTLSSTFRNFVNSKRTQDNNTTIKEEGIPSSSESNKKRRIYAPMTQLKETKTVLSKGRYVYNKVTKKGEIIEDIIKSDYKRTIEKSNQNLTKLSTSNDIICVNNDERSEVLTKKGVRKNKSGKTICRIPVKKAKIIYLVPLKIKDPQKNVEVIEVSDDEGIENNI
uniref:Uncharacterized protein n=1 Tax=Parastrongyloides trichosuri TaxID=131310 RepID=A0A0N4Z4J9_PARTI